MNHPQRNSHLSRLGAAGTDGFVHGFLPRGVRRRLDCRGAVHVGRQRRRTGLRAGVGRFSARPRRGVGAVFGGSAVLLCLRRAIQPAVGSTGYGPNYLRRTGRGRFPPPSVELDRLRKIASDRRLPRRDSESPRFPAAFSTSGLNENKRPLEKKRGAKG